MELIETFLTAHFGSALRHQRRLAQVRALEAAVWPIRNGDPS
jgi:hypothetical protein